MEKTKIKTPKKNCYNCKHIENVGLNSDLWSCNKTIFEGLAKGVEFLVCPLWKEEL